MSILPRPPVRLGRSALAFSHIDLTAPPIRKAPPALPTYCKDISKSLSYHWDTLPPSGPQLSHATQFFEKTPASFLWSAPRFCTMAFGDSPEICFVGRSNVGKSSLVNALLGVPLAHSSNTPGRTRLMNAFAVGGRDHAESRNDRLVLLDMPGYGAGGKAEWGKEIMKYIISRKQLKRTFLLVDIDHGFKQSDNQMMTMLRKHEISFQVVLAKVDKVIMPARSSTIPSLLTTKNRLTRLDTVLESAKRSIQQNTRPDEDDVAVGEVISCTTQSSVLGKNMGIDALRFAMLRAANLHIQPEIKLIPHVELVSHEDISNMQTNRG